MNTARSMGMTCESPVTSEPGCFMYPACKTRAFTGAVTASLVLPGTPFVAVLKMGSDAALSLWKPQPSCFHTVFLGPAST